MQRKEIGFCQACRQVLDLAYLFVYEECFNPLKKHLNRGLDRSDFSQCLGHCEPFPVGKERILHLPVSGQCRQSLPSGGRKAELPKKKGVNYPWGRRVKRDIWSRNPTEVQALKGRDIRWDRAESTCCNLGNGKAFLTRFLLNIPLHLLSRLYVNHMVMNMFTFPLFIQSSEWWLTHFHMTLVFIHLADTLIQSC